MKKNIKINIINLLVKNIIMFNIVLNMFSINTSSYFDFDFDFDFNINKPLETYASSLIISAEEVHEQIIEEITLNDFILEFDTISGTIVKYISGKGSLTIPNKINGVEVKYIADNAFYYCTGLETISTPNTLKKIGDYAFEGCKNLKTINISDSLISIGKWAFANCSSLLFINIADSVAYIGDSAFKDCTSLISANIPTSTTSIGKWVFRNCSSLLYIDIHDKVTEIGEGAFLGCSSIVIVDIPDSVILIDDYAFRGCTSLILATIPNSNPELGEGIFYNCHSLISINFPNKTKFTPLNMFFNCTNLSNIYIPDSVEIIYMSSFINSDNMQNIYYSGSRVEWNKIEHYLDLEDVKIHYNISEIPDDDLLKGVDIAKIGSNNFIDLNINDNYYNEIKYLVENDIMTGVNEFIFLPSDIMTKLELINIIYELENKPNARQNVQEDNYNSLTSGDYLDRASDLINYYKFKNKNFVFSDISHDYEYTNAIYWARDIGLVTGTNNSNFYPNDALTREQVVAIIERYYDYKNYNLPYIQDGSVNDIEDVASWFTSSIDRMYKLGILNVDDNNNFNPKECATKQDVAYILANLILKL